MKIVLLNANNFLNIDESLLEETFGGYQHLLVEDIDEPIKVYEI